MKRPPLPSCVRQSARSGLTARFATIVHPAPVRIPERERRSRPTSGPRLPPRYRLPSGQRSAGADPQRVRQR